MVPNVTGRLEEPFLERLAFLIDLLFMRKLGFVEKLQVWYLVFLQIPWHQVQDLKQLPLLCLNRTKKVALQTGYRDLPKLCPIHNL